jgi:hypothetical protein
MDTPAEPEARCNRAQALAGMLGVFLDVMPGLGAPLSAARHLTQQEEDAAQPRPDAEHRPASCFPDAPPA